MVIRKPVWIFVIMLIIAVILNVGLFNSFTTGDSSHRPKAVNGELDLSGWDFQHEGILKMDGTWMFYGGQLLGPNTDWGDSSLGESFVSVPSSWNNYELEPAVRKGLGYATYRLLIRVPEEAGTLAIRVPNIMTAYKLWINGDLIAEAGQVDELAENNKAEQYPRVISFASDNGIADLVIQVSNYKHRKGGIWTSFSLGTTQEITRKEILAVAEQMLIIGSLFIIGTYHMGLYAFRKRERFTLSFGLLCLCVAFRMGVTGETMMFQRFPGASWELGMRIEYIAFALCGVTGYTYIYRMFPQEGSKRSYWIFNAVGYTLSVATAVLPVLVYTRVLVIYQLYIVIVCATCMYVVTRARIRNREGATLVLAGITFFIFTVINDILFYSEQHVSVQLVPFGITFFILVQSIILSNRFTNAMQNVELVSDELRELNANLEQRVELRTNELKQSNESLEHSNIELEKLEKSRRHLLSNISHDLRTPMTLVQGYLEAMRDGLIEDKDQQQRHLNMMLGKLSRLNSLIDDLFELSKLEAGQVRFHYVNVSVRGWLESVQFSFETDVNRVGGALHCVYNGITLTASEMEQGSLGSESPIIRIDIARMEQVMSNLIYNALRYLPEADSDKDRRITIEAVEERGTVVIEVTDTGCGIDPEDLPYIFDRFYKKDKSRNSSEGGSGLGLSIVKEIVHQHGGWIEARNTIDHGASFLIRLPLAMQK
ncbi:GHKL domain-containing protein [Paenibacillus sp. PR3]|uniref:histidine kinase n=1 Tax=Paenibacillus terricola TaxID=2763503 RepID=A0ABR8MXI9_9BACL|nr:sensor histidine kinase [Paenibacillus terricola]MBD3918874.1 GHKL domain-containing protein [Paenibacillus terricola]